MNKTYSNGQSYNYSGEVDLFELAGYLWKKKIIILLFIVVFACLAAVYAYFAKPVYQVNASMLPPPWSDIAALNIGRDSKSELSPFNPKSVYAIFTHHLTSDDTRKVFFNSVYRPFRGEQAASRDRLYAALNKQLTIAPKKDQPERYELQFEGHDPELAADWASKYIDIAATRTLDEILKNIDEERSVKAEGVLLKIKGLREVAEAYRQDRLIQLNEALHVAKAVGLKKPPFISGQISDQLNAFMNGNLMYMRGAEALQAEIDALESRKFNDPFIPDLRRLQELYNLYSTLEINKDRVSVFYLDGSIDIPDDPVKPRQTLIIAGGVIAGGVLGLGFVFILFMIQRRQHGINSDSQ